MNILLISLCVQVASLAVSRHTGWKRDPVRLWRVLAPFADDDMEAGKEGVTAEQLKVALSTKDEYGLPLALPPLKVMQEEVDANKDGFYSKAEMVDWKGYQGHVFCNNLGDRSYGCSDRCVGGLEKPNGNASYFKYPIEKFVIEDDSDKESTNHYTGGITRAHQLVLKKAMHDIKEKKIPGELVYIGMKAFYPFRLMHDELKALGDTTTKIHLYDTFTGYEQCDTSKDTSMCPKAGSAAVDEKKLEEHVAEWADKNRVIVHKVADYNSISLPSQVSFALVDGALYKTTKSMLDSVHSKLSPKASVFVHDFGWEGFPGVEKATTEVASANGMTVKLAGTELGVACYLGVLEKGDSLSAGLFR